MTLSEVMHVHIPTLSPESSYRDAVDKMDIYQFPALVIAGDGRKPLAVITEGDLARAASANAGVDRLGGLKALDFASREPVVSDMDVGVSEALHLMLSKGLTILPVTHEGRLAGIVLRVDLMQALLTDAASPSAED
ncbi:MAG: CBS domain-containing protein [Armatimonadetes bacterium]|nr:CBS domain-containing protein [Armatimonadota bacterium]